MKVFYLQTHFNGMLACNSENGQWSYSAPDGLFLHYGITTRTTATRTGNGSAASTEINAKVKRPKGTLMKKAKEVNFGLASG